MLEITTVDGKDPAFVEIGRTLFLEYSRELGEDMCFQGFDEELAALPGKYAPPDGRLLLGAVSGAAIGCVAVRPLWDCGDLAPLSPRETRLASGAAALPMNCEMKRLYIRPKYRGEAFGRELAEEIVALARDIGYEKMRLDTLARLVPAVMLYRSMGFVEIPPYYDNPIPGVVYMEKDLV